MSIVNQRHASAGLYTASKIAELLSVEPKTIHNWAEAGKIPVALRTGKTIRFDHDKVMMALAKETAATQRKKEERLKRPSTWNVSGEKAIGDSPWASSKSVH